MASIQFEEANSQNISSSEIHTNTDHKNPTIAVQTSANFTIKSSNKQELNQKKKNLPGNKNQRLQSNSRHK
jgi:hypothetical protein